MTSLLEEEEEMEGEDGDLRSEIRMRSNFGESMVPPAHRWQIQRTQVVGEELPDSGNLVGQYEGGCEARGLQRDHGHH